MPLNTDRDCPQPLLADMPSSPVTSFVTFFWMCSSTLTCLLYSEAQNCTQYSVSSIAPSQCRTWHFPLLNFMPLLMTHCSNLARSFCRASHHHHKAYSWPSSITSSLSLPNRNLDRREMAELDSKFFNSARKQHCQAMSPTSPQSYTFLLTSERCQAFCFLYPQVSARNICVY